MGHSNVGPPIIRRAFSSLSLLKLWKFMSRIYTSNLIIDVDYAFKGTTRLVYWKVIYWLGHFSLLLFLIIRLIFVSNTPDIVHVPRITLHQDALKNEEHYQFRNDLERKWFIWYIWISINYHIIWYIDDMTELSQTKHRFGILVEF